MLFNVSKLVRRFVIFTRLPDVSKRVENELEVYANEEENSIQYIHTYSIFTSI